MDIDFKQLKRLADACRKAGIKSFKGHGIEFTLDDRYEPPKPRGKSAQKQNHGVTDQIETNSLTPEELMFWSTGIADESGHIPPVLTSPSEN